MLLLQVHSNNVTRLLLSAVATVVMYLFSLGLHKSYV